ncbi:MAG: cytochrome c [Acidobacteria bacterium]|nr:cytochrome c [Acidobacteriota bacterium]MBI3662671.1 cytochrome c [Acidobacteriota bacterium]
MTATTATVKRQRTWAWPAVTKTILLPVSLLFALGLAAQGSGNSGYFLVPGEAKAGMKTFFDKGCIRCHAVMGEGGRSAPDLGRAPAGYLSASEIVAAMWNHAPQMWTKMQQQKVAPPSFSASEMANLFAFLYSVRSMDEPGDAERGRQLFSAKRCGECHQRGARTAPRAPDLSQWASYRNPVSWIQAMWNHAPAMQALMEARGYSWPEFQGSDVADLLAYVRTQVTSRGPHLYLRPASPDAGKTLFTAKGCANCHTLHGSDRAGVPDLGTRSLPRTLGQFAAQMWNHSPTMWVSMKAQNIPRPQFSNKEMADLVAYLFAERYFEASGNSGRGRRMFEVKGCGSCHVPGGSGSGPDLSSWQGRVSPVRLATSMWNHGPVMLGRMQEQQMPWPVFQTGEMVDLMEHLNRGLAERQPARARR